MNTSETDLEYLRQKMVKEQLMGRDIRDRLVLEVFKHVPRHKFIDTALVRDAYSDFPLPIDEAQTISQPYMAALLVQLLDIKKDDKVLEIGTGSGFETAILAELASAVFSIERKEVLAKKARKVLGELGYKNIQIKIGDGTLGWEEFAPFNKIIVTASAQDVPKPLLDQLSEDAKLVMPVGPRFTQSLLLLEKAKGKDVVKKNITTCTFVPLIGKYGWEGPDAGKTV